MADENYQKTQVTVAPKPKLGQAFAQDNGTTQGVQPVQPVESVPVQETNIPAPNVAAAKTPQNTNTNV
jgi:hypothetical protein